MAAFTLASDVVTLTGTAYSVDQQTRMTSVLIPRAERYVKRVVGRTFYDAADRTTDASQDWLLVVSLIVEHYLFDEDPEQKEVALGPYQSEKLGDYSYTLKSGAGASSSIEGDPRIAELLATYQEPSVPAMVVNGPTRETPPVYDAEVDVSRSSIWGTIT